MKREDEALLALFIERELAREEIERLLYEYDDKNGEISKEDAELVDKRIKEELDPMTKRINSKMRQPVNKPRAILEQPDTGFNGEEYRKNFVQALRTGFKVPKVANYLQETGLGEDGGYLVPIEFDSQIVSRLESENIMRKICRVITTASEHRISIVASKPSASWLGEGDPIQLANEKFSQKVLEAKKLAVAVKTSNEILADAFVDIEGFLAQDFGDALARAEEDAFLNGTGTNNQPLGLLPALSGSATSFITTTGAEISADDLITLEFSIDRPYRRNSCWLTSDATLAQIRQLKDSTSNFIWQPSHNAVYAAAVKRKRSYLVRRFFTIRNRRTRAENF